MNITNMLNASETPVGCVNISDIAAAAAAGCTVASASPADWAGSFKRQEISRVAGGIIVSVVIVAFSAPPAAVIWRTPALHRVSYLYVMTLSILDCLLGAVSFTLAMAGPLLGPIFGGIPCWVCVLFEAATNGCMNAVNVIMLVLGRDRYLSLAHALSYPLLATAADVRRHVKMAAAYGALHAAIFIGARAYFGCLSAVQRSCLPLNWLLRPEYNVVAVVTVFSNVFLDAGTIIYNGYVMYWAWKLRKNQIHPQFVEQEQSQGGPERLKRSDSNVIRQHTRIFVFTFKIACLFLVCSLPYKLAILLFCLGAHSSVSIIRVLAMVRMLYFILDGWTFCSNKELLDAGKAMLKSARSAERLDP